MTSQCSSSSQRTGPHIRIRENDETEADGGIILREHCRDILESMASTYKIVGLRKDTPATEDNPTEKDNLVCYLQEKPEAAGAPRKPVGLFGPLLILFCIESLLRMRQRMMGNEHPKKHPALDSLRHNFLGTIPSIEAAGEITIFRDDREYKAESNMRALSWMIENLIYMMYKDFQVTSYLSFNVMRNSRLNLPCKFVAVTQEGSFIASVDFVDTESFMAGQVIPACVRKRQKPNRRK